MAFSPNGRRLLTLSSAGVRLHDARSGEKSPEAPASPARQLLARFSPDSRWVLTGDEDRAVRIWDAVTARLVASLPQDAVAQQAVFSPDQRFIATATAKSAMLWRVAGFAPEGAAFVQGGPIRDMAFSPAGDRLMTLSGDGVARVFLLDRAAASRQDVALLNSPLKLAQWAALVAGRALAADGQLTALTPVAQADLWNRVRFWLPGPADDTEQAAWHRAAATSAEEARQWFTAAFHWDQLAARHHDLLAPARLEAARTELAQAEQTTARDSRRTRNIPPRDSTTGLRLLDLTAFYNASLDQPWLPARPFAPRNDLAALAAGVHRFNGIDFDVRGIVQLSGSALENRGGEFPQEIRDVPVGRACRRLHFLHGAAWTSLAGTPIASYVVRYEDGDAREIKVVFGRHVREWWSLPGQPLTSESAVAWEGANEASEAVGFRLRLFQMPWTNPRPDARIATIDCRSLMEQSAPFLIAITAE